MQNTENFRFYLQLCIRKMKLLILQIQSRQISLVNNQFFQMISIFEKLLQFDEIKELVPQLLENFQHVMDVYALQDYILTANYLDGLMIKQLEQFTEQYIGCSSQIEIKNEYRENYQIEYTASGMRTLSKKLNQHFIYLHTNDCPFTEAWQLTERWKEKSAEQYIVAGLGLGYYAFFLSENPLVEVYIYEEDKNIIELAKQWSDIPNALFQRKNIHIIYDPSYQKFTEAAKQAEEYSKRIKICIYYPSVQTIYDEKLRNRMLALFMQLDNFSRWETNMNINFRFNTENISRGISGLQKKMQGKVVYLIAGGPSLDKNIHLLKERPLEEIVLTTGTSLRRCIDEKINPDFTIITDPKQYVYQQIKGITECKVPLILLSTSFAHLARDYQGEKYLLCQEGYQQAEELAAKHNWDMVQTGGSVMTTALDLCIKAKVKRIVFLGLDLAFTDGRTHHGQPEGQMSTGELKAAGINGGQIPTSKNLNAYRKWIENRIAEASGREGSKTEFIDATEGGARINGAKIMSLAEAMKLP